MYLGVAYEIKGKSRKSGRNVTIKKKFMDVCFAGMNLSNEYGNNYRNFNTCIPTTITYWPFPNREVIKSSRQIESFLNVINRLFTKSGVELNLENYFKGVTVSADLSYAYILAYFSAIRMLDENPYAAESIADLNSLAFERHNPHLLFLIGSSITNNSQILSEHYKGHPFPEWRYWNKGVLDVFKGFEDTLLAEPPYKEVPHKSIEIEPTMFGKRDYWKRADYLEYLDNVYIRSVKDTSKEIKKWFL